MNLWPGAPFWASLHPAGAQKKTLIPTTRVFHIAYTNMLASKKPQRPNANHCRSNVSPHLSWWNIIRIGYTRASFALGILIS